MRVQIVDCKYRYQAIKACPWACKIVKVDGGYKCYESYTDYQIARNQR